MKLSVLYRGSLTSCNYACGYCPFAKRTESATRLASDRESLDRFQTWITRQTQHVWRILFTPWGEALVRAWYRESITRLTWVDQIESIAAQTNLSCGLDWIDRCRIDRLAFWATYHPGEVRRAVFVAKVLRLHERGARVSVGTVGATEAFAQIESLRRELPAAIPVWVNPQQPRPQPYTPAELDFLSSIDPLFEVTSQPQRTFGMACRTGETSFTVDGAGDIRRCHFVDDVIGNIGQDNWEQALAPRTCPNRSCRCYLGLAHFEPLGLDRHYGSNLLERIPLSGNE